MSECVTINYTILEASFEQLKMRSLQDSVQKINVKLTLNEPQSNPGR